MNIITNSDAQILPDFLKWCFEHGGLSGDISVTKISKKEDIDNILPELCHNITVIYYCFNNSELNDYIEEKAEVYDLPVINLTLPVAKIIGKDRKDMLLALRRQKAIDFTLKYDDGTCPEAAMQADVVIIGVSRTAKTPLCLLLANYGFKAINIPLIPEVELPSVIERIDRRKIIGITVSPELLYRIRTERVHQMGLSESLNYVHHQRIMNELEYADKVMKNLGCTVIDVSHRALEETAHKIMKILKKRSARNEQVCLSF